uniref:Uncharacterized protein n=1 Tax=Gallus gallus TaxID=9031 RepID=A0A8V0ZMV3_CHICK
YHVSSTTMWEHSTVRFPIFSLTLISAHPISQWITYTHCSLEALRSPGPHHQTQKDVACCLCPGKVAGFSLNIFISLRHLCTQPSPKAKRLC